MFLEWQFSCQQTVSNPIYALIFYFFVKYLFLASLLEDRSDMTGSKRGGGGGGGGGIGKDPEVGT